MSSGKIKKAIFPVGGLGTRFLPATKALPKEMMPIANKPLIQHAFEEAINAGIDEFIFITGRNKNIINNHFDCVYELESLLTEKEKHEALHLTREWVPEPGKIAFIRQQHPLGLGHAVWCARHFIKDEPFAVLLADELFVSDSSMSLLSEMIKVYSDHPGNIVAVSDIGIDKVGNYGIVDPENDNGIIMEIRDMVEKPSMKDAPSNISIVGRYILEPGIFDYLENIKHGSGGEIQLTDAIKNMIPGCKTYGYRFKGDRMDCGNHLGFLEANIKMALRDEKIGNDVIKLIKDIASRYIK
jgi:UTP--glucose-1-phosphate uridylyltransferase